jgi:hypothetical protein
LASAAIDLKNPVSILSEDEPIGVLKPAIHPHIAELPAGTVALLRLARRQAAVVLLGETRRARIAPEAAIVIIKTIVVIEAVISVKPRLLDSSLQHLQALLQLRALSPVKAVNPERLVHLPQLEELTLKTTRLGP